MPTIFTRGPNQQLRLPDGRLLGYDDLGPAEGPVVFYFHGAPSSRVEVAMFGGGELADRLGIRLVAVDRPGIGLSTFQPGRHFESWPADVAALADALGVERFGVLAYSGGGPYALACALGLPGRVTAVALVGGVGPFGAAGLTDGINPDSRRFIELCRERPGRARLMLRGMGLAARFAPGRLLAQARAALPPPDQAVLARPEVAGAFLATVREVLRQGPAGGQQDVALMSGPWEMSLSRVRVPVRIWHGEADGNAPVAMARYLADAIPGSRATILPGEGHLSILSGHAHAVLTALVGAGAAGAAAPRPVAV